MGIPLDFAKRGEQVISLYTWYLGGKQSLVNTVDFQYPYAYDPVSPMKATAHDDVNLMSIVTLIKASASGHPSRISSLPFPMMNIMETDGHKTCRQPISSLSTYVIVVNPYRHCKMSAYS